MNYSNFIGKIKTAESTTDIDFLRKSNKTQEGCFYPVCFTPLQNPIRFISLSLSYQDIYCFDTDVKRSKLDRFAKQSVQCI